MDKVLAESGGAGSDAAAKHPTRITLVAFGDSLVHGYGLPAAQGFVPQLEDWLNANGAGPVTVINAGESGGTTRSGLSRVDWSVGPDADAVILELGANDALRGLPWELARDNLDAMLARLAGERGLPVLLAGMRAIGNYDKTYKAGFDGMYAKLAEKHGVPLYPFFLSGLTEDMDGEAVDKSLVQSDNIHPSAKGVAKIVESIGPAAKALVEDARARKAEDPQG